jgi:hypothetical protein
MIKRIASALVLLAFVAVASFAAPTTVKGKVASIEGNKVQVTLTGEKADWVKNGAGVKIGDIKGRITSVTDTTLTFTSKKASELKVDAEVTLEKGPAAMTGC